MRILELNQENKINKLKKTTTQNSIRSPDSTGDVMENTLYTFFEVMF